VSDISNCECSKVILNGDTKEYLTKTKYDCLCNSCLTALDNLIIEAKKYQFPKHPNEMIEGIHFYIERGYLVFTELYHLLRGKCCQSGCRHCAYGFKNNTE
jgi:hypothetical protein